MSKYFIKHCIVILVITKKNVNNFFIYMYRKNKEQSERKKHKMMEIVLKEITWQIFLYQLHLGKQRKNPVGCHHRQN